MWLAHVVARNAVVRPDRTAVADVTHAVTWAELDRRTAGLAGALERTGIARRDRVVVLSLNRVEVVESYMAAARCGAIVCPINPDLTPPEVAYILGTLDASLVLGSDRVLQRLAGVLGALRQVSFDGPEYARWVAGEPGSRPLPELGDTAAILQTSATTGRPKGVVVSHRSLMACYTGMAAEAGFGGSDVMLNPCPLFHGSMVIGLAALAAGATLVVSERFTPQNFLIDLQRHAATRAFLVPSMVRFTLQAKALADAELGSLTEVMYGAAPMPAGLLREAVAAFGCGFRNVYGITEGGGPIALLAPEEIADPTGGERRLAAAGRMMPGVQLEVQSEAGRPLPPGEVGEICMRGDGQMSGYWRNPAATAAAFRDGWLLTGDLGSQDDRGFLFLVDRRSDLILRGGQNVYPAEVERALAEQPGVLDVAVVAGSSEDWGQVPVAFVVPADPAPPAADLLRGSARQLASYKRPVRIEFVDEIPRSPAGKVLRKLLRQRLDEPVGAGRA
jgi:acyl-CoA synthetase (AMP-forming)/AMP-acid ligase II